jgi:hypothetical protein
VSSSRVGKFVVWALMVGGAIACDPGETPRHNEGDGASAEEEWPPLSCRDGWRPCGEQCCRDDEDDEEAPSDDMLCRLALSAQTCCTEPAVLSAIEADPCLLQTSADGDVGEQEFGAECAVSSCADVACDEALTRAVGFTKGDVCGYVDECQNDQGCLVLYDSTDCCACPTVMSTNSRTLYPQYQATPLSDPGRCSDAGAPCQCDAGPIVPTCAVGESGLSVCVNGTLDAGATE